MFRTIILINQIKLKRDGTGLKSDERGNKNARSDKGFIMERCEL